MVKPREILRNEEFPAVFGIGRRFDEPTAEDERTVVDYFSKVMGMLIPPSVWSIFKT